jgi:hypothetical protein
MGIRKALSDNTTAGVAHTASAAKSTFRCLVLRRIGPGPGGGDVARGGGLQVMREYIAKQVAALTAAPADA